MKKKLYFSLILILLSVFGANGEVYTTPDGHRFEVNLIPDKTEIMIGEPLFLSFEVKNLSDVDLSFSHGGDYRNRLGRPLSFEVEAVRSDGKKVPVPEIKFNMGGLVGPRKVEKNGGTQVIRLFLPLWAPFEETGEYSISCVKSLGIRQIAGKSQTTDYSNVTGVPVAVKTKLKVVAGNEAKMSELVDFWGEKIITAEWEKSYEAIKALDFIGGKRIIKPLVKALNSEGISTREFIIRLLGKFADEEAFSAIVAQMGNEKANVRGVVAEALSFNKHPKAFEYLLKLKDDEDKFVRLSVMQALGRIGTTESIAILREMIKEDRNKEFYEYVKFFLEKNEK